MTETNKDQVEIQTFLEYLQGFKAFVSNVFRLIWKLLRKNALLLSLPLLLGLAFGVSAYLVSKPLYTVEMQLSFNELHKRTYGEMILRLQQHLKDGDIHSVAEALNMTDPEVEHLVKLEALNIVRSPLHEDASSEKFPFYIVAQIDDRSITAKL